MSSPIGNAGKGVSAVAEGDKVAFMQSIEGLERMYAKTSEYKILQQQRPILAARSGSLSGDLV